MKPWIKRTLFGVAGAALVAGSLGSLSGCAGHRHGWNAGDGAEFRTKMVERVGTKLELDAAQKQKLETLAGKLHAQRMAVRAAGSPGEPGSQFRALFAASQFDQAGAARLIDEKTAAVKSGSAEVISAAADFFDHLSPAQQQKVRDFMERGGRWGRR